MKFHTLSVKTLLCISAASALITQSVAQLVDPAGYICLQDDTRTWQASQVAAKNAGAELVSIRCPEQNQRLLDLTSASTWVGGNDIDSEGNWMFPDGPMTYTNWNSGMPNNASGNEDCLQLTRFGRNPGGWNDLNCNSSLKAIYHSPYPIAGLTCIPYVECPETESPSESPSVIPSDSPSDQPSSLPSDVPSDIPSDSPSDQPSSVPSDVPSDIPSDQPSSIPSDIPSDTPSSNPSSEPSDIPSTSPSLLPSSVPSDSPSSLPSLFPSSEPSWVDDEQCKKKDPENDICAELDGRCKLDCEDDENFVCVPGLCSYDRYWDKPTKSPKMRQLKEDEVEIVDIEIAADGSVERNLKMTKAPSVKATKAPKSSCACRVPKKKRGCKN